jgi:hypothetical protein
VVLQYGIVCGTDFLAEILGIDIPLFFSKTQLYFPYSLLLLHWELHLGCPHHRQTGYQLSFRGQQKDTCFMRLMKEND